MLGKYEIINDLEYFLIHGKNKKGACSNELDTCRLVRDKSTNFINIQESIQTLQSIVKVRPSCEDVKLTDLN